MAEVMDVQDSEITPLFGGAITASLPRDRVDVRYGRQHSLPRDRVDVRYGRQHSLPRDRVDVRYGRQLDGLSC